MAFGFQAAVGTDFTAWQRKNARRQVIYAYPNGAATLVGLLSLANDAGVDPVEGNGTFYWPEKRFVEKSGLTQDNSSNGHWNEGTGATIAAASFAAGSTMKVKVTAGEIWNVGDMVMLNQQPITGGTYQDITGEITVITFDSGSSGAAQLTLVLRSATPVGTVINASGVSSTGPDAVRRRVVHLGNVNAEGSLVRGTSRPKYPIDVYNYTQIFRDPFSFTRNAMVQPMTFDRSGLYKERAKDVSLEHMIGIENAFLFGDRGINSSVTGSDSVSASVKRYTGGIAWFLKEYEKADGGSMGYRTGGAALTALSDDQKRILQFGTPGTPATITVANWKTYLERAFRSTSNSSHEKLLLCGSGLFSALHTYYEGRVQLNKDMMLNEHKLSMNLWQFETEFGTLYAKTHPRFNENVWWRYDGFILDVANLRYRHVVDADTKIRSNIHANDFDGRTDEFFTECGLELRLPETHMWLRNLGTISG